MHKQRLSPLNEVLTRVTSSLGLDKRLREHTFMSLWPTFVSPALSERSRPLFIDHERKLIVSVADSATAQELSMSKGKVVAKVAAAARSLNIEVQGIRLDLKHFHSRTTMPALPPEKHMPQPTSADLEAVVLNQVELEQINRLQSDLRAKEGLDMARVGKIAAAFEHQLRLRRWLLAAGYPVCPRCGNPAQRLHQVPADLAECEEQVCLACLYSIPHDNQR